MKKSPSGTTGQGKARRRAVASLRAEYDFRGGTRGKYTKRVPHGTYLILLDPDVAKEFRSERDVNRALREYLRGRTR